MQPSSVFSLALLAVWLLSVVVLVELMPVLLWLEEVPIELLLVLGDVVLWVSVLGVVLLGEVVLWLVVEPIWLVELELLLGVWVLLLEVLLLCATTIIVANSSATSTTTIERIRIQETPGVRYW
jgi:hypothetical protein